MIIKVRPALDRVLSELEYFSQDIDKNNKIEIEMVRQRERQLWIWKNVPEMGLIDQSTVWEPPTHLLHPPDLPAEPNQPASWDEDPEEKLRKLEEAAKEQKEMLKEQIK